MTVYEINPKKRPFWSLIKNISFSNLSWVILAEEQNLTEPLDLKQLKRRTWIILVLCFLQFHFFYLYFDEPILRFFGKPENESLRLFMRELTDFGLGSNYFLFSSMVYLFCRFVAPSIHRWKSYATQILFFREWARHFFMALLSSGFVGLFLKMLAGRQRPLKDIVFTNSVWSPLTLNHDFQGFPSGHTQVMFCAATMMTIAFPRFKWVFYGVAIFIGLTRIVTLYHFPSDVLSGAAVGYLVTNWYLYFSESSKGLSKALEKGPSGF